MWLPQSNVATQRNATQANATQANATQANVAAMFADVAAVKPSFIREPLIHLSLAIGRRNLRCNGSHGQVGFTRTCDEI